MAEEKHKLGTQGTYSKGKLNKHDKGDLKAAILLDPTQQKIVIDFGTQLSWIALGKEETEAFIITLQDKIKDLKKPV